MAVCIFSILLLSFGTPNVLTLTGDGTVQGVTLDHETLPSRLSVCLEDIDSLDRVLFFASWVDSHDSEHGVDGKRSKEVVVADPSVM